MNPTDASQLPLRDIHLPGLIGWWPPAPGWWLLAVLLVAGLALYGLHWYRGRHRRVALRALVRVRVALEQGAEPVACLQYVSTILRRFAMTSAATSRAPTLEPPVPGLIGERWLRYLDSRWGRTDFAAGAGRQLLAAPYARPNSIERMTALELTAVCMAWLTAQPTRQRPSRAQPSGA